MILTTLNQDELQAILETAVETGVSRALQQQNDPKQDELLKIDDVCRLFKVSKVAIFSWKKRGLIPFYRVGGRVFYKKSEVLSAMKKIGG